MNPADEAVDVEHVSPRRLWHQAIQQDRKLTDLARKLARRCDRADPWPTRGRLDVQAEAERLRLDESIVQRAADLLVEGGYIQFRVSGHVWRDYDNHGLTPCQCLECSKDQNDQHRALSH